jgi:hypothetical protein
MYINKYDTLELGSTAKTIPTFRFDSLYPYLVGRRIGGHTRSQDPQQQDTLTSSLSSPQAPHFVPPSPHDPFLLLPHGSLLLAFPHGHHLTAIAVLLPHRLIGLSPTSPLYLVFL